MSREIYKLTKLNEEMLVTIAGRQGWQYGTYVRYVSIFAKRYGTLVWYAFFVMVRVWYVGTLFEFAY